MKFNDLPAGICGGMYCEPLKAVFKTVNPEIVKRYEPPQQSWGFIDDY